MKRVGFIAVCALLAAFLSGCAPKTLLLVTQYPEGSPRVAEMEASIRKAFAFENLPFNLVTYNMDASASLSDVWRQQAGHNAVARMQSYHPAMVFVAGDEAARDFARRFVDDPRHIKMMYMDIKGNPSDYGLNQSPVITGVTEDTPIRAAFQQIKDLVPSARRVAVLSDRSIEGNAVVNRIRAASDLAIPVVEIRQVESLADWMAAVQEFQGKADTLCVVSYHTLLKDPAGTETVPAAEVLNLTSRINRLPDFSFWKEAVGPEGVMAAVSVPAADQATLAAKMAVRVLYYDEPIGNFRPVLASQSKPFLSADRAATFGIALSTPPGR